MENILYDYFRSSCAYRVRIALYLKQIPFHSQSLSLLDHEQYHPDYLNINPMAAVPSWHDAQITLSQSLAILEYLDEAYPNTTKILPNDPVQRAKARQLALIIACDIHPLNNLRVKEYLNWQEPDFLAWYHHWLQQGFDALETLVATTNHYCVGHNISIADICLIPQVYNALRFNFELAPYPKIQRIYQHCQKIPAFVQAYPQQNT